MARESPEAEVPDEAIAPFQALGRQILSGICNVTRAAGLRSVILSGVMMELFCVTVAQDTDSNIYHFLLLQ